MILVYLSYVEISEMAIQKAILIVVANDEMKLKSGFSFGVNQFLYKFNIRSDDRLPCSPTKMS